MIPRRTEYTRASRAGTLIIALFAATAVVPAAPPSKVALTGARIITVTGDDIPKGTLLMESGKIVAVGPDVEIPYDAMEVECPGKVLFPGMVHPHSPDGLDRSNENLPVAPFVDVYDSIDPSSLFFENSLRDGITSIHVIQGNNCVIAGVSRVVHPIGRTPDEMTQLERLALKFSTSPRSGYDRMLQMELLRETFAELDDYLERRAESKYEETLKEENKELDVPPEEARKRGKALLEEEDLDDKHRNLVRLRDGRLAAWIYCGAAMDVAPAVKMARDQGFLERTVLVLGPDAIQALEEIRRAGRPVVLPPELFREERDPLTGEVEKTFLPKVCLDGGVEFSLQPSTGSSLPERYLNYQAARLVREGIPREVALRSITIHPARALGLEDRFGSLEAGKAANVLILSGDPLDFSTWVEQVYIEGVLAYDKQKDVRLKTLLEQGDGEGDGEKEEQEEEQEEEENRP